MMKLAIFGTGYVGLVTGACLADNGIYVTCVDIDAEKIDKLKKSEPTIYEPGLKDLLASNLERGKISFTLDAEEAARENEVIMITVGTPMMGCEEVNLDFVLQVARTVGNYMEAYKLIVQKSTAPAGTCQKIRQVIQKELQTRGMEIPFSVASNPEFLKEGDAVKDFLKPDRVILGVEDDKAREILRKIYHPFMMSRDKVIEMKIPSAELTKYANNSLLAAKISFINEFAQLAEVYGADITEIRKGIGSDRRIGYDFLYAGVGFGGSCFPKDVKAIISMMRKAGTNAELMEAVDRINCQQQEWFMGKISLRFSTEGLKGKTVAAWGLAFKAGTDDMRESRALYIVEKLIEAGAKVKTYDPQAMENFRKHFQEKEGIQYCLEEYEALRGAEALVILTEWAVFRNPDFKKMKGLMNQPVIFDGRNLFNPSEVREEGFEYTSVGR